ncbi:hypothetical protein P8452_16982 [Trifolium repens]|nr:hypothetical protein P8452_16982 [Trifolium repens]
MNNLAEVQSTFQTILFQLERSIMRRRRKLNVVHHGDPSLQKVKIVVPPLHVLTIETLDKELMSDWAPYLLAAHTGASVYSQLILKHLFLIMNDLMI